MHRLEVESLEPEFIRHTSCKQWFEGVNCGHGFTSKTHRAAKLLQMVDSHRSRFQNSPDVLWISDPAAIEYLAKPTNLECLVPFLGRERTLTEAAEEVGARLSRLHYQVNQFLELKLLRVTRSEPRAGRAIRHYTALASRLFVPFDTTSFSTLEEALERAYLTASRSLSRDVARHTFGLGLPTGLRVSRGLSGGVVIEPGIAPGHEFDPLADDSPAVIPGIWTSDLNLSFTQAKALQRELEELRQRYSSESGGQRYQLQIVLVPSNSQRE